ncbi:acyltransferase [Sphingomonas sp. AR_OL41]|uniref:acyltransferase n=1 Tax=Sphingomonas sp. AR_OL41 TaxID=3042729 RepID=UPI002480A342|nr:acyltransferase [Sphingomonas sp. AR_OL41]MDH7975772.1 acyltransferase [Sphingomonas sp. AR_OL41]
MMEMRGSLIAALLSRIGSLIVGLLSLHPRCAFFRDTAKSQVPITLGRWFAQRVLGINGGAYWPMHTSSTVSYAKRIRIGKETSPGWSAGCYIHGINGIFIGDYTQISMNVGIQSANHDPYDLSEQLPAPPIVIGKYCLLGMGSLILPGVVLGDYTIVAANAVVTKSFPQGFVVLAGVPARVISELNPASVRHYVNNNPYCGYIPAAYFDEFCRTNLQLPPLPHLAAIS